MADLKISQLTGASTPLAGTEVLPIVQSSSTVKVSVANLTAGRAVSAASLALTTSPLPTTSGGTALTSFTNKGVVYASSTSALATGSALEFDGTNFGIGTGGNTMNHQSVVYKGGGNAVYFQIGNGASGLGSTQGIRLGLDAVAASELYTVNSFTLYVDGTAGMSFDSSRNLAAGTDNNQTLGTAAKRWSVVYAGTAIINTSDKNQKQQIRELSIAEKAVALRLKNLIRAFKFNDAVAIKGQSARIHVGVIAQDVAAAFENEGLDAYQYGMFCSDEMEDGSKRLGIRYDELLAFVVASL